MRETRSDLAAAQRAASRVGLITLPIGIAIMISPDIVNQLLRLGAHRIALRAIGAADLAIVPGLLAGRCRLRWMTARVGLNLLIAAYCSQLVRRQDASGAKVAAIAMVVATVADGKTILSLRRNRAA